MRKFIAWFMICLFLCSTACAETTLRTRVNLPETFAAAHPEVRVETNNEYLEPDKLLRGLITQSMEDDVFYMFSSAVDVADLIDKGYLLDLSGNETIRNAVSRMYPDLQALVTRGDAIYAVPTTVFAPSAMMVDQEVWAELGYTEADVPKSFPALLDFLEAWVHRNEQEDLHCNVMGYWDETLYNEYTYAGWLIQELMTSWIQQKEYAGEPLRFNTPELVGLLDRCMFIGRRIYNLCEPRKAGNGQDGPAMFTHANLNFGGWDQMDVWMVDMRISEDQPTLIPFTLAMSAAYCGTKEPELAAELIAAELVEIDKDTERVAGANEPCFLYADAEPIPRPDYEENLRSSRNYIAIAEHRLAGDNTPLEQYLDLRESDYQRPKEYDDWTQFGGYQLWQKRLAEMSDSEVEDQLEQWQASLAYWTEERWSFSPENLAVYRQFAQHMYIETPGVFREGSDVSRNYWDLLKQYKSNLLPAQQFVSQLDNLATMVELEQQ